MKICIIPARGGSKRIPRKNIKEFNGAPIISYSIKAAIASNCFDRIIVSTDDEEIANVSKSYGAEVPFIRPKELSNDFASTLSVIKHAIGWFDNNDINFQYACCLYATAPFLQSEIIYNAFRQLLDSKLRYCFSVTSYSSPIQRSLQIISQNKLKMLYPEYLNSRSQDLDESFHDAGQFYWGDASAFREGLPIFSELASPFQIPRFLVQDIDTTEDWTRAEAMYVALKKTNYLL